MTNLNRAHGITGNYWAQIELANGVDDVQVRCPGCDEETSSAEFYHGIGYGTGFKAITSGDNDMGGLMFLTPARRNVSYSLSGYVSLYCSTFVAKYAAFPAEWGKPIGKSLINLK